MPAKQPLFYPAQKRLLTALGERLRLARLRRKLTIEITCQRASISRMTLFRAEAGSPAIALGTLLRILSVLGLEGDLEALAQHLAAQAGIEVPASELRRFSGEYHTFCVQRFDRSGARRRLPVPPPPVPFGHRAQLL